MPRFHFNVSDGSREPDSIGKDLPTLEQARLHAAHQACRVLEAEPSRLRNQDVRIEVSDARGLLLFTLIVLGVDSAAAAAMV